MSRARDYRRNKDGRAEDRFAERRRRFGPVLRALGLAEEFGRQRRRVQEMFWRWKRPDPEIAWEGAIPVAARRAVERAMREASVGVSAEEGGAKVSIAVRDFLTVLEGMWEQAKAAKGVGFPPAEAAFMARVEAVTQGAWERHQLEASQALFYAVFVALGNHCRVEGCMYWANPRMEHGANGKLRRTFGVCVGRAERVQVRLPEGARPALRVGHTKGFAGVEWVSWDGRGLGVSDSAEPLPVFVQSHAIKQLHARMDGVREGVEAWIEYHMGRSLAEPVIVERQRDGDLLVEYRVNGDKVGYLVARVVEGRVVVRTFLLMTMRGTPEGERLYRRFRLTRDEAGWLGLNKLSAFTGTDLADDPELRGMLVECGCGGLLELPRVGRPGEGGVSFAAELRRYLRMGPAGEGEGEGRVAA